MRVSTTKDLETICEVVFTAGQVGAVPRWDSSGGWSSTEKTGWSDQLAEQPTEASDTAAAEAAEPEAR